MFKFLVDMKNDLNYVKTVIAELIKNNNLTAPHSFSINNLGLPAPSVSRPDFGHFEPNKNRFPNNEDDYVEEVYTDTNLDNPSVRSHNNQPIIIQNPHANTYENKVEAVDASLNLAEKEKEIIVLALKKHHNRRKEASEDLGISERTLYRKIKDYGLD